MTIPPEGRLAGIDFGTVRIGIALSDPQQRLASPLENYQRAGQEQDARRFRRLVEEENVAGFVVGLPVHGSGEESRLSKAAREFGAWLRDVTGVPVEFYDERYTSLEAERHLQQAGMTRKRRRERLDKLAAQIMLAHYLEASARGRVRPEALDD